ncbi:hypothetical protein PF005_g18624 [Phytophthora fragariae]|uniref:C2H2-type domain-containing protein n=1 Tax=Phytophthora fragariae TaxID=53985 RepID=A0A6A3WZ27_9STRA|nr:hypothetical protein PF010_g17302 [Phytophthora fragariae]KAE9192009.1 hypothetical protein PF005_g18624 [Phytophthora fragariae]
MAPKPKPRPPLPPCGYLLVSLGLRPDVLRALQDEARSGAMESKYHPIFNKVGGECDDACREMARVHKTSGAVRDLKIAVKAITDCLEHRWIISAVSFLRSHPGGDEQKSHQDYPDKVLEAARKQGRVLGSMLCARDEDARVLVYDGCTNVKDESKARIIEIPVGFCIIFRGDLIHNRVAYDRVNHRMHCYLTFRGLKREPDMVSNVLPPHFECQYCEIKLEESNAMRYHRRYCLSNPKAAENELKRRAPPKGKGPYICNVCGKPYDNDSSYRTHVARGHAKKQLTEQ